jgi:C1A family cysteine protease
MLYQIVVASLALPLNTHFESWKKQFGKTFATVEEETKALQAYEMNDAIIRASNAKNLSYTLGHNEFSGYTWEDFQRVHMGELFLNRAPKNMMRVHLKGTEIGYPLDDTVDWVAKGAVTAIKNQGHCGSCWAFSTTGAVEGAMQIATGKLISLSEEDLVECDHNGDQGCKGGLMDNAFEFIHKNGGIATEEAYPYTSSSGQSAQCDTAKEKKAVTVTSHKDVPKGDEDALKSAVAKQPVSIAIEADKSVFQLYKSGVFDSASCGKTLDHGVLVVGYGTDSASGKDYWKVKNSWGETWGMSGYMQMVRGKDMCGISESASYPTGASAVGPSPPGPSPGPSPTPTPPSPPAASHYEDPKDGCQSDEMEITIQGVTGDFCTPACGFFKPCPKDVPEGVTAQPQCALQDSSTNKKYCALICSPSLPILDQKAADDQCGTNASCKSVQMGIGLCTYDD